MSACYLNLHINGEQIHAASWPEADLGAYDPAENTGCQAVIESGLPLIASNTDDDPILCNVPIFKSHTLRAYLGIPVWTNKDSGVDGAFCVVDTKPREWGYFEVQSLIGLADLAGLSVDHDSISDNKGGKR